MLLPSRWWSRTVEPLVLPQIGDEMLGFNEEAQGWLPCKVVEKDHQEKHWTVNWWDNSQEDRTKGEEELRPFEEAGWWYRIIQKTRAKRCLHCQNSDGTFGRWRVEADWQPKDWAKTGSRVRRGAREASLRRKTLKRARTRTPSSNGVNMPASRHETKRRRQRHLRDGHADGYRSSEDTNTWTALPVPLA